MAKKFQDPTRSLLKLLCCFNEDQAAWWLFPPLLANKCVVYFSIAMQLDNPIIYFVKLYYYHMAGSQNSSALKIEKKCHLCKQLIKCRQNVF